MRSRRGATAAARLGAVVLAVVAAVVLPGGSVSADGCAGVTAVVDFGALGGGVQQRCVADGAGRPAWDVFEEAGFPLTPVQQYPDAVCRVSGAPASDPCVRMPPANAYWGLYWSSGRGWVYSSQGAHSLTVAAGGSVGFAWENSTASRAPGVAASSPRPSPTPTRSSTPKPRTTTQARPAPAGATASATAAGPASRTPSASPSVGPSVRASAVPSAAATTSAAPSPTAGPSSASAAAPVDSPASLAASRSDGGLPWWVPVLVLVALAAGGGGAWWRRRRTS